MDPSPNSQLGVFLPSHELSSLKSSLKIPGQKCKDVVQCYPRTRSLQKLQQPRTRFTGFKANQKVSELPELRKNSKSVRDISVGALIKGRLNTQSHGKAVTKSASLLAKGSAKLSRKYKRDSTVTSPCRTSRYKDTKQDFEAMRGQLSVNHARTNSQLSVMPGQEDPYHYLNVAALGTATAFKDILHSRGSNESQLISSFDKVLKARRNLGTSLNVSARYAELSPLRTPERIDDTHDDHDNSWTSKRAALLFSRVAAFSADYQALEPVWEKLSSIKPDRSKLLAIINFEGVIGTFIRKDSRIVMQLRFQGIQALKYLQEYFDVVLVVSAPADWTNLVMEQLAMYKVVLTGVYCHCSTAKATVLNYSSLIASISSYWRPAVVVSASSIALDDIADSSLYSAVGTSFKLNAFSLPAADRPEHTPVSLIIPHLKSEDPSETVSAFVMARTLYDLAFKTSSSVDWRKSYELLYNGREPALRCSYTSFLHILKTDVLHEALIEMQSAPISKLECPIVCCKRPSFPMNYYGVLQAGAFQKSQKGMAEEVECMEGGDLQL